MINRKNAHTNTMDEINSMIKNVRSINESLSFENLAKEDHGVPAEDDLDFSADEQEIEEPKEVAKVDDLDTEMSDIDRIREIALKGMVRLVKQSNSPEYETLKKIFQFCDKVNNEKGEEIEK